MYVCVNKYNYSAFFITVTGRVACKQMMPKDEERLIKEGKEKKRKNLATVDR